MTNGVVDRRPPFGFAKFLGLALGILGLLFVVGYVPTKNLGGDRAIEAMFWGGGASLAGSVLGAIVVYLARGRNVQTAIPVILGAMALRLFVVLLLGLVLALAGGFERVPLLLWLAIGHAGLLVADTKYSLGVLAVAKPARSANVGEE